MQMAISIRPDGTIDPEQWIKGNRNLVFHLVRKLGYGHEGISRWIRFDRALEPEDVDQVALIGARDALVYFDPTRGIQLSTLMATCINNEIRKLLRRGGPIRISAFTWPLVHAYVKADRKLTSQLGRQATSDEIRATLPITDNQWRYVQSGLRIYQNRNQISCFGGDEYEETERPVHVLAEVSQSGWITHQENLSNTIFVQQILAKCPITDREREVIQRRFGIGGYDEQTLQEIKNELGLSLERIRQIEKIALDKLKRYLKKHGIKGIES